MADEKRPKIDLKARLGKTAGLAPTPTPQPGTVTPSGRPMPIPVSPSGHPMPVPPRSSQPPGQYGALGGMPIPPPTPYPGTQAPFDPSNPLASAVAAPYAQRQRAPEPQRIEFDDLTLQQASKSARKQGIIIGGVVAVLLGVVGYVAGGAVEQASGRASSKAGAEDLAVNATKARDQLKTLAEKMEAGRKLLMTEKKFPASLITELGGINVDFDGKQLEGRRFSGYSTDTTRDLVEFITAVQGVNDRKRVIQNLLTSLQKPISDQLAIPEGQVDINWVVVVDKDLSGNMAAALSHLVKPITINGQNTVLPPKFTFTAPGGSSNVELPRYLTGDISKAPAALYVTPRTFDSACPAAATGQIVQLGAQIGNFIAELRGEGAAGEGGSTLDSKAGLIDRADKLVKELGTVGK
jgi:hypothetical protein